MKRNSILKFIIDHKSLDKFFSHFKWYNNLIIKRAREIIDGRRGGFCLMPNVCNKCGKILTLFEGWTCLECERTESEGK